MQEKAAGTLQDLDRPWRQSISRDRPVSMNVQCADGRTIIIGVLLLDSQFCWRGLQSRGHVPNLFEPDQWRLRLPPTVAGRYTAQPASGSIRQWLMFDGPPSGAIRVGL